MSSPQRITLIGFSGTGKSTVAGLVARELGWIAVDSDELIAEAVEKTIPEIFAKDGEMVFRRHEAEIFAKLATQDRLVTAAGGGATTLAETRRESARTGLWSVWKQRRRRSTPGWPETKEEMSVHCWVIQTH